MSFRDSGEALSYLWLVGNGRMVAVIVVVVVVVIIVPHSSIPFLHPVCSDSTGKDFYPRFAQDKSHANRTMQN